MTDDNPEDWYETVGDDFSLNLDELLSKSRRRREHMRTLFDVTPIKTIPEKWLLQNPHGEMDEASTTDMIKILVEPEQNDDRDGYEITKKHFLLLYDMNLPVVENNCSPSFPAKQKSQSSSNKHKHASYPFEPSDEMSFLTGLTTDVTTARPRNEQDLLRASHKSKPSLIQSVKRILNDIDTVNAKRFGMFDDHNEGGENQFFLGWIMKPKESSGNYDDKTLLVANMEMKASVLNVEDYRNRKNAPVIRFIAKELFNSIMTDGENEIAHFEDGDASINTNETPLFIAVYNVKMSRFTVYGLNKQSRTLTSESLLYSASSIFSNISISEALKMEVKIKRF